MALPPLDAHRRTLPARRYGAGSLASRVVVARDKGPVAQRFAGMLGIGVRHLRADDTLFDVAGIVTEYSIDAPRDAMHPTADGLPGGGVAVSGFAWARTVGEITGSQTDWSRLDLAVDGDALSVVIGGPRAGFVKRAEPGDIVIGHAICTDEGYALVRLALPKQQ